MRFCFTLDFPLSDLAIQPQAVAEALEKACQRHAPARLLTLLPLEDRFLVVCQPGDAPEQTTREVQVDCLFDASPEALKALVRQREEGGYLPVGVVSDFSEASAPRRFLIVQR